MPHTKQQLQELLAGAGLAPRHKWGQNFLIDLNLMRLLVEEAGLTGRETVLEAGCGTGSMTDLLAQRAGAVVAVDIDEQMIAIAAQEWREHTNITFICADVLARKSAIEPEVLAAVARGRAEYGERFLLIANLPYQIASPLLIDLLLGSVVPDGMYVTIQAEVAERILAEPGTKAYGLLSILMQSTGTVQLLRKLKPTVFWPMPNVQSAAVVWRKDPGKMGAIRNMRVFKHVIDRLLGQRRKKIKNCLPELETGGGILGLLAEAQIDPDARGETVEPEKYVHLANLLAEGGCWADQ